MKKDLPQEIVKVLEFLNIEYDLEDVMFKKAFFPDDVDSWVPSSVYESGSFKLIDGKTVERVVAHFDENENKLVESFRFTVNDDVVEYAPYTEFEDDNFLVQSYKNIDSKRIETLATCYDKYVQARELDYREGVASNDRIIKEMEDLCVYNFTIKNYTPMFSDKTEDWKII